MKKILLVLLLLLVACTPKEVEPEPIGFGTTLYLDVKKNSGIESVDDLVGKNIGYQERINTDEVNYVIDELSSKAEYNLFYLILIEIYLEG